MKTFLLYVLRPIGIVLFMLVKIVVVFVFTSFRDIARSIAEELNAVREADPDDWLR